MGHAVICMSHPFPWQLAFILQKLYMFGMATDQTARWLERVFTALSDPLRARILSILAEYEVTVSTLVEVMHTVQPVISRQLAHMREAQLVETRREGKWIWYSLQPPPNGPAGAVLLDALQQLKQTKQTQIDLAKLTAQGKRT